MPIFNEKFFSRNKPKQNKKKTSENKGQKR